MSFLKQISLGLLAAITSSLLVIGALSVASVEGFALPTATFVATPSPGLPVPGENTPTPLPSPTPVPPTSCPPPQGWQAFTVQNGDTLDRLAAQHKLSKDEIVKANCLISETLLAGSILYLPPLPTPTHTPVQAVDQNPPEPTATQPLPTVRTCGRPPGWTTYVVQVGDNLYRLSIAFGTTVRELQEANCLPSPNYIQAGMVLFVPNVATRTPEISPTATRVPPSNTPVPPSSTPVPPSSTPVPPSSTPVTPSDTPVPPSDTPVPPSETPAGSSS